MNKIHNYDGSNYIQTYRPPVFTVQRTIYLYAFKDHLPSNNYRPDHYQDYMQWNLPIKGPAILHTIERLSSSRSALLQ